MMYFSKPLFKQSAKANWVSWLVITVATCFMLGIILGVVGGNSINSVMGSLSNVFVEDVVESEIEKTSMSFYYMTGTALESYDNQIDAFTQTCADLISAYDMMLFGNDNPTDEEKHAAINEITAGIADVEQKAVAESILMFYAYGNDGSLTSGKVAKLMLTNMITDGIYAKVVNAYGEDEADMIANLIKSWMLSYSEQTQYEADVFATNIISLSIGEIMAEQLLEYDFSRDRIETVAENSIINFRAQLFVRYPDKKLSELETVEVDDLIGTLSLSLIDGFEENVKTSLEDMRTLDLAKLMTGSIFFKIAGLLLPVIYIIIVSNSLIAGQVDSGSMAYVLSTPTKRKSVVITQISFLVLSLLLMCVMTAATGVITLAAIGASSISYAQMIYLNIGLFVTLFAFSGICFFASSWFNRSKHSIAIGGGISMYFLVATILGLFGSPAIPALVRMDAMNLFNFTTITYFFDTGSILDGTSAFIWKLAILVVIGAVGYLTAIWRFNKKDLPL